MQLKQSTIPFLIKPNIAPSSCLLPIRYLRPPDSLQLLTNILEQRVVNRKLLCQTFFVADSSCRETVRNCTQSQTLWSNMLLPCDVGAPHDEAEAVKRWVGQLVIFENGLERASNGIAPAWRAVSSSCPSGTNRNSASGSTNRRMSQG